MPLLKCLNCRGITFHWKASRLEALYKKTKGVLAFLLYSVIILLLAVGLILWTAFRKVR